MSDYNKNDITTAQRGYKRYLADQMDVPGRTLRRWKRIRNKEQSSQAETTGSLTHDEIHTVSNIEDDDSLETDEDVDVPESSNLVEEREPEITPSEQENADLESITTEQDIENPGSEPFHSLDESTQEKYLQEDDKVYSSQQQNGLLLMALKMKHKLTKEAVSDMLDIINLLAGKDTVPQSWYHLEKQFEGLKDFVEIHHVCNFCESYLGKETSEKCTYCEKEWIEQRSLKEGNFFFHLPLHAQIKAFLEDPELSQKVVRNRHGFQSQTFCDITSGKKYQDLSSQSTEETLTVMFSCDGLPVFKSSSFFVSMLCVINELPATERFNHIFLASLWFGCKKPDMSVYLQPFVFECRDLATEGLLWVNPTTGENTITKVITTVAVCDTVARPMLQNMTQFNGKHGCGFCLDSGDVVPKNRGTVRAYPYKTNSILRNAQATLLNAEGAVQSGKSVNGVKGPSLLGLIPHFDIISNFVPDYMHCILLGVCKQMATLWFDSQYHQYQFYIGLQINKIDSRLLDIKPPSTISRVPRSESTGRHTNGMPG
ncbi:hypothetical protein HHUSO_G2776 [Huso huso]|uniref:Uncharacterized protein n=1 Tax=Huso huso TaxID=61971 RepID=A0ABR1A817_HUSHU